MRGRTTGCQLVPEGLRCAVTVRSFHAAGATAQEAGQKRGGSCDALEGGVPPEVTSGGVALSWRNLVDALAIDDLQRL